MHRNPKN
jgi:hypothetical protein